MYSPLWCFIHLHLLLLSFSRSDCFSLSPPALSVLLSFSLSVCLDLLFLTLLTSCVTYTLQYHYEHQLPFSTAEKTDSVRQMLNVLTYLGIWIACLHNIHQDSDQYRWSWRTQHWTHMKCIRRHCYMWHRMMDSLNRGEEEREVHTTWNSRENSEKSWAVSTKIMEDGWNEQQGNRRTRQKRMQMTCMLHMGRGST